MTAYSTDNAVLSGNAIGVKDLRGSLKKLIIGNENLIDRLLIALLADGNILLESMPGLAKTTAAKALAHSINGDFHRIQFTPDLLPSDLTGSDVYNHTLGTFSFIKGPMFQNILLADEINRAPAKVQSALLEAMEEKQITVGQKTYRLPELFMVIATQNPIEQEGTYNLPEAQLDRFMFHVCLTYPTPEQELKIIDLNKDELQLNSLLRVEPQEILLTRQVSQNIYIDQKLKQYVVSLVQATRHPELYSPEIAKYMQYGASVRATLALIKGAKALAWLEGNNYVIPEYIQRLAPDVLRHRISLSYHALAENITKDEVIERLLNLVVVP